MKRSYVLLLIALVVVFSMTANAQYSRIKDIVSTNHNMSSTGPNTEAGMKAVSNTQICYYCHTPHPDLNTTDPAVTTGPNGQTPLWNHYLSSKASYGIYSSPSFDAFQTDIADVGTAVAGSAAVTNLCLSCHDGTVGINTLYKGEYASTGRRSPDFGGGINVASIMPTSAQVGGGSAGLSEMHPLNFTYDAVLAGKSVSLVVPVTASNGFGGTRLGVNTSSGKFLPLFAGKMQCASCHDVHSQSNGRPFLRASTTGSELCLGCHGK
jgi:predicted CXXCH cytochrome family protein